MLKLVEKIRSLAKSATDLASRGVDDAAEFLHAKLWDGTPRVCAIRAPARCSRHARWRSCDGTRARMRQREAWRDCGSFAAGQRSQPSRGKAVARADVASSARAEIRGMKLDDIMPLIRAVRAGTPRVLRVVLRIRCRGSRVRAYLRYRRRQGYP
jgi:hypothetical protein